MQMDFYGAPQMSGPALGLEEGQVRLTCSPGMVKVYLSEFPWEKCVPEGELEATAPYEVIPAPPPEVELEPVDPAPLPAPEPGPPALPAPEPGPPPLPGKARFLDIDPATGAILDPDTGQTIRPQTVLSLTPVDTGITVAAGLIVTGVVLAVFGVFGGK